MVGAMELRSFKVRAADGHVRVVTGDTSGDRATDLLGANAQAVIKTASPLLRQLSESVDASPPPPTQSVRNRRS